MIKYMTGDLLEDDAQVLVNTVNCVGVMGRGIALQFKKKFPENFKAYEQACKANLVVPGRMFVFAITDMFEPRYIVNFPTKRHWRENSRIEDIESGLDDLVRFVTNNKIKSIAIPPIGSGLGRLNWSVVKNKIEQAFIDLTNVEVRIYQPSEFIKKKSVIDQRVPNMTKGRASLLVLSQRYLNGYLDPSISLLEVQKLMFFLQEAGEPLRLNYSKGLYGPYAENLRHVLRRIEGHFIRGYEDGGDNPMKQLELITDAVTKASELIANNQGINLKINKVFNLIEGFESSFGLELLATVYWAINDTETNNLQKLQDYIYCWSERKKQFTPRQIKIAQNRLIEQNWIPQTV